MNSRMTARIHGKTLAAIASLPTGLFVGMVVGHQLGSGWGENVLAALVGLGTGFLAGAISGHVFGHAFGAPLLHVHLGKRWANYHRWGLAPAIVGAFMVGGWLGIEVGENTSVLLGVAAGSAFAAVSLGLWCGTFAASIIEALRRD